MALSRNQISGALMLFSRAYLNATDMSEKRALCRDFIDTFKCDIEKIEEEMRKQLVRDGASDSTLGDYDSMTNDSSKSSILNECVITELSISDENQIVRLISKELDVMPCFSEYDVGTVKDFIGTGYSFAVKRDDEVIGVALAHKHMEFGSCSVFINIFVVNEAIQGYGVGTLMMNHLKKLAKDDKITKIKLYTKKYLKAYDVYKHLGFREDDKKDGVYMTGYVF